MHVYGIAIDSHVAGARCVAMVCEVGFEAELAAVKIFSIVQVAYVE
jgi:hypothetical protein